jgi:hypothetical protein
MNYSVPTCQWLVPPLIGYETPSPLPPLCPCIKHQTPAASVPSTGEPRTPLPHEP